MFSEFVVYLRLGFDHITDVRGYDHFLFIAALTAVYRLVEWKRLLGLVTAFTLGHSITLALATLDLIRIPASLVEVLIPGTILVTSVVNIVDREMGENGDGAGARELRIWWSKYGIAAIFGLIHGMGFSNFLRAALGGQESILLPLFSFNVGLEMGQILIVLVVLAVGFGVVRFLRGANRDWTLILSGATGGIAVTMILDRLTAM